MLQIQFGLGWHKPGKPLKAAFKQTPNFELFQEYKERISKFTDCEVSGIDLSQASAAHWKTPATRIWVCDRSPQAKILSSEELAQQLRSCLDQGTRKLWVLGGGPDGTSEEFLKELKPQLRWSFGKFTLPHELASVIASEQIYRAWTILKGLPYHSGH